MYENNFIKEDLKELLLSDKTIKDYFLVALLHKAYKEDKTKEHEEYTLNEYEALKSIVNKKKDLHNTLSSIYDDTINNKMIDEITEDYLDLSDNEGKGVIYSLSRLLYLQEKYKDDEIGKKIDAKIKEWLEYIKTYDDKQINEWIKQNKEGKPLQDYETINNMMSAYILYNIIPNINFDIAHINKHTNFMELQDMYDIPSDEMRKFLENYLNNKLKDAQTNNEYSERINHFINGIESNINFNNFINDKEKSKALKELKEKYNILDDDIKPNNLTNKEYEQYEKELYNLFNDYLKNNEFNIQTDEDIKNWRDKADKFIKHLKDYDTEGISLYGLFTTDYMLDHLAYSDYQKKAYKLDLENDIKVVKIKSNTTTPAKEDTEQEEKTTPISQLRNHSLKNKDTQERDYIMMSSTKQANDLVNSITSYASYNESIYSIQKNINELENKDKKSASEKDRLNYLKDKLENRIKTHEELEKEENQLINTKKDISEKLTELDNQEDIDHLTDIDRGIDKRLEEIKKQKNNSALVVQHNLFTNDIEYNGKYITTSIDIDNFDLSKFTDEGITIFLYMIDQIITNPNIKDLTFDIDFIFNKMNKYKHNKKSVVRKEIENLTDILYNMNIRVIKEDKLNNLEVGRELRVITGRQWVKDKKEIKDSNGLKSMTITFNDDFKTMILNSKTKTTRLGDVKQVNQLQYYKIPLNLITLKNKKARGLGFYLLQQDKLNRKNGKRGLPLKRTMKHLYNNDYLKLKYNKKQGQFKKDIVYKLEDYLNQLEDNKIILYNTDAFDKLRYDLSNKPIEEQKRIFDEEIIEIKVIPPIINNDDKATKN